MSATVPATIGEKVSAIVRHDDTGHGFTSVAERRPKVEQLSEWERDLLDWGAVYGLAFGIARVENPFESIESVAERAFDAAWPTYLEWSGQFAERSVDPVIGEVVREFHKTCRDGSRLPRGFEALEDALVGLANAAGS